jgi:hypothetical protein
MSRGLSQQQKNILAVALHVNKRTNGGSVALKTGKQLDGYRVPTVNYAGVKDLHWGIAANVIHRLGFGCGGTTSQAKSIKASTIRAISKLLYGGFLAYAPHNKYCRHSVYGQYTLTQLGVDYALGCEPVEFDDWTIFRSGLCIRRDDYSRTFDFISRLGSCGAITFADLIRALEGISHPPTRDFEYRDLLAKSLNVTERQNLQNGNT